MGIKALPVWKWALLLLASLILAVLMYSGVQIAGDVTDIVWLKWLVYPVCAAVMIALYALFVRWFEKHPAADIPLNKLCTDTLRGLGVGFCFFVAVVLVMIAGCLYHIEHFGTDKPLDLISSFLLFLCVGVGEEIMFRGVLFRWIDEKWGFWVALLVSAVLFGALHIAQPGATWWSSLAIAIEAGLLLGAAYKYSGTLWLPIGIHWIWNFTQGNVFGFEVSGSNAGVSLISASVSGPDILTGGSFGAEASIITVVFGFLLSAWYIRKIVMKKG